MRTRSVKCFTIFIFMLCMGCGHTIVSKVGLLSVGELQGKRIPGTTNGFTVQGEDCGGAFGSPYYLSKAVRAALEGTQYDTIVDAKVTTSTGLLVYNNCVAVKGEAIRSSILIDEGDTHE